jgi:hypothetical protein
MILDSKMRYAHKGTPEERRKTYIQNEEDELEITEAAKKKQKARGTALEAQKRTQ